LLGFAQGSLRKTTAVTEDRDGLDAHAALELEHAERPGPRRLVIHDPGAGGVPAQHIPDQARDRRPIAGTGKAMRRAPLLQRLRRRGALRLDGLDDFNRRGQARLRCHARLSVREMSTDA
jgi:hypothetical protein